VLRHGQAGPTGVALDQWQEKQGSLAGLHPCERRGGEIAAIRSTVLPLTTLTVSMCFAVTLITKPLSSQSTQPDQVIPTKTAPGLDKIHHVIWIIQENHSFDNYFGTFPGADGIPPDTCLPKLPGSSECVAPFHMPKGMPPCDVPHEWGVAHAAYDNGKMDGFVWAEGTPYTMGYYDAYERHSEHGGELEVGCRPLHGRVECCRRLQPPCYRCHPRNRRQWRSRGWRSVDRWRRCVRNRRRWACPPEQG
jgi:hypothetical protein